MRRPCIIEENVSSTSHIAHIDGREIKYTATVGTIPVRLDLVSSLLTYQTLSQA